MVSFTSSISSLECSLAAPTCGAVVEAPATAEALSVFYATFAAAQHRTEEQLDHHFSSVREFAHTLGSMDEELSFLLEAL